MANSKFTYECNIYLFKPGVSFVKKITFSVPLHKGMILSIDLPGLSIRCFVDEVEIWTSEPLYPMVFLKVAKQEKSTKAKNKEKIIRLLRADGWKVD